MNRGRDYKSSDNIVFYIHLLQIFGRTPLTVVSPKKTLEGAFAGFGASVVVTIILSKVFNWPTSFLRYFFLLGQTGIV